LLLAAGTLLFARGPFEDGPPEDGPFGDEASVFAISEEGVRLVSGAERAIVQHDYDRVTRKTLPICVSAAVENHCMDTTSTSTVIVLTTTPVDSSEGKFDAVALGRTLVEEGLAACVNVLPPMESVYRWLGSVHQDAERQLVIKTRAERVEALYGRLKTLHPYEVPEFLVLPVSAGSPGYLDWVRDSVTL
jgi:periplasmic divalent cation tolerance protein